jgi:hypothetical protein
MTPSGPPASDRPLCVQIDAWMDSNPAKVPRSYETLITFPSTWRGRLYASLSAEEKSGIWRTHLSIVRQRVMLTDAQRTFLDRLRDELTPAFIQERPVARIQGLIVESDRLFEPAQTHELFYSVGPASVPSGTDAVWRQLQSPIAMAARYVNMEVVVSAQEKPCNCSAAHGFCNPYCPTCYQEYCCGNACRETVEGCGWLWMEPCTGRCYPFPCQI